MTLHVAVVRRIRKGGDVNDTADDVIAIVQSDPSAAARALRYVNSPAQQDAARRNGRRGGRPKGTRNRWCTHRNPTIEQGVCTLCNKPKKGE